MKDNPLSYKITFDWDDEVAVWIATSKDIHGLVLEHESFDMLVREVLLAVPTLLELSNEPRKDITLDFITQRQERLAYSG